jgi:hypothetical protein
MIVQSRNEKVDQFSNKFIYALQAHVTFSNCVTDGSVVLKIIFKSLTTKFKFT